MYLLAFSFDFDRNLINFYKLYNQETVDQTYISLDVNSISDIPNLPIFTIDPDVVTHNKFFNGDEDNSHLDNLNFFALQATNLKLSDNLTITIYLNTILLNFYLVQANLGNDEIEGIIEQVTGYGNLLTLDKFTPVRKEISVLGYRMQTLENGKIRTAAYLIRYPSFTKNVMDSAFIEIPADNVIKNWSSDIMGLEMKYLCEIEDIDVENINVPTQYMNNISSIDALSNYVAQIRLLENLKLLYHSYEQTKSQQSTMAVVQGLIASWHTSNGSVSLRDVITYI